MTLKNILENVKKLNKVIEDGKYERSPIEANIARRKLEAYGELAEDIEEYMYSADRQGELWQQIKEELK